MKNSILLLISLMPTCLTAANKQEYPNIVLVMADDQGWGQVGYNGHPLLKTPNLDAMAQAGIRFDRFYAAGPVCSPTRASVLTGRTHNRTGVPTHGKRLCLQEKTLAQALKQAGYSTAHFGKWHLNGVRGPGVPVLGDDENHPGHYGFDTWLSVTNFFDLDPLMSRNGKFEAFKGDSSEIIVAEALKYMETLKDEPFFAMIWYGSPHNPMQALDRDRKDLPDDKLGHHLGEIVRNDPSETRDVSGDFPQRFEKMKAEAKAVLSSIEASAAGRDYPEGKVLQAQRSAFWRDMEAYQPHFETFARLKPGFVVPGKRKKD